jgi:hypothetical protein
MQIEQIEESKLRRLKKAKAEGVRVRMVRDKFYINNVEFKPQTSL